eukprot:CAMPEP_0115043700 /NCGR_PEP_ID=MMETSP0216-20121206/47028_1 /TAXON_ID=223996 /ORGANISM="Protocruzia adherens, Strain Boccale" /LENGTH=228 /DNA_ID=CAMNT_0002426077 /DNA_START=210 /DNA_END=896 /DNA_ORIENTATION=+
MCKLEESLSLVIAQRKLTEQKLGEDSDDNWAPTKLDDCQKRCEMKKAFRCFFSSYLSKNIVPSIDRKTCDPIWDQKFVEENKAFSELYRITERDDLSFKEKTTLIKIPTQDVIDEFIRRFFTICDLLPEVITLAMILLQRFLKTADWKLRSANWRVLVLLSVQIAQKHEGHSPLTSRQISILYPLFQPGEVLTLEASFLRILDYRCYVSSTEYSRFLEDWISSSEDYC